MCERGRSAGGMLLTFVSVADAILKTAPPGDRDWVCAQLEGIRAELHIAPPLSISDEWPSNG